MQVEFTLINSDYKYIGKCRITKYKTNIPLSMLDEYELYFLENKVAEALSSSKHNDVFRIDRKAQANENEIDQMKKISAKLVTDMSAEVLVLTFDTPINKLPTKIVAEIDFNEPIKPLIAT